MKMNAIIKPARSKGLELVQKEVPQIGFGEALVKIHYTAICGTDVHIYDWNEWAQKTIKLPMTIGHEFVGEIVEIKGATDNFKVGDIVSAEGHVVCGKCRNCRAGRKHLCPNTQGIGVNRDGIFAEYARIPISNLWLCDTQAIPEKMYAIFDPLGNATHTALKFGMVGEDVLITGAGPIGIMAAAICRHVGAKNVVLTDISDYRLELAKQVCPSIVTVNTKEKRLKDIQQEIAMVEGFDIGLEMSGSPIAFNEMIDNMIMGGKIAMLGVQGNNTTIDWNKVIFNMLTIQGIYGREVFETWHKMTAMLKSGLDISKIITAELPYTEFEKGFEMMHSGKSGSFLGTDDTILYSSCFDANGGLFETITTKEDAIISDELNHASIIDGVRLSKATKYRYKNNDMEDLETKLKEADVNGAKHKVIVTDGVFSMDGIIANLKGVCDLAEKYNALVVVDDSHATGFVGDTGRGTAEYCGVQGRVDIITGTFGKALGGASGGFTSGRKEIINLLRQRSRPYLFSNTVAPAICATTLKVLEMIEKDTSLRDKVMENARYFRTEMEKNGFDLAGKDHAIIPVMLYDAVLSQKVAEKMLEKGIYVTGFFYPVVPKDKARIRTQMSAGHSKEDIDKCVQAFVECKKELGF